MAVEEYKTSVRFRVSFPKTAYGRLEVLADRLAMEVPDLVRVMASVQLAQWELMYLNPRSLLVDNAAVEEKLTASMEALFPELPRE